MRKMSKPVVKRRLEAPSPSSTGSITTSNTNTDNDAIQAARRELPVFPFRDELVRSITLDPYKVLLISSATGSGKSTQIPAYLLDSNLKISVTQPRRVAAITLAQRVALENSHKRHGVVVGYRVRFDDCTTSDTQLVYVTDGMLLRESMVDPLLSAYSVVFLDEAHERSLHTDILLGVVQRARMARINNKRPLKVVVMSATLQIDTFVDFFTRNQVHIIHIPGRQFPVQTLYTKAPVEDFLEASLATVLQIHHGEPAPGDILVFLPGQEDIENLASLLRQHLQEDHENIAQWTAGKSADTSRMIAFHDDKRQHTAADGSSFVLDNVMVCNLYAALPPEAQLIAFQDKPHGCTRKIILATNIAETSVTLPAIQFVVDCGKQKTRVSSSTGMDRLVVQNISQAQAMQRSGRAGRVQAGLCFRLYTQDAFDKHLPPQTEPEILRVNLAQVVLQLKGMGIVDVDAFEFVTRPTSQSLQEATKLLFALQAVDEEACLTEYGKRLAKLPLDPLFGHLLLQSAKYSCVSEMLTAVSSLSAAEHLLYQPRGGGGGGSVEAKAAAAHARFKSFEGDLPTLLNVYDAWRNEAIYIPPSGGGRKRAAKKLRLQLQQQQQQSGTTTTAASAKISHGDWCQRNFVSGRALVRAYHIRQQLQALCKKPEAENGLGMNVQLSCGKDNRINFHKCLAAGLFLQVASRVVKEQVDNSSSTGRSGSLSSGRFCYRTKIGNQTVSIHPSSSLFMRNPAPACVVFTELVTTKRSYIRGLSQIREEWLQEVAPLYYPSSHTLSGSKSNG